MNNKMQEKPAIYVKKLCFNDGTSIELNHDSIVVFVGTNNSGKSQVLKDIEGAFVNYDSSVGVIVKSSELAYCGDIKNNEFIEEHFEKSNTDVFTSLEYSFTISKTNLLECWSKSRKRVELCRLFVNRLDTERRLTMSNPMQRTQMM